MSSLIKVGAKWRAQVLRKGQAPQCKTFAHKTDANAWAREREARIDAGQASALPAGGGLLLSTVLQAYREVRDGSRPIAGTSNEHYMLRLFKEGLGDLPVSAISAQDLVGYCTARRNGGAGPYTCSMEISKLGKAMRYAGVALPVALPDVVAATRPLLSHLGPIGGGGKRWRRSTQRELEAVVTWLARGKGTLFSDIVHFAVFTEMGRGRPCA